MTPKLLLASLLLFLFHFSAAQKKTKTENIILITLDGFRWQEVFTGADSSFMKQQTFLKDPNLKEKFWRSNQEERRKALLPFMWTTLATQGQLYGNRALGSKVDVSNNQLFSYPGYNEILTGSADNERIHSNDKIYNPNTTVLEFLNNQQRFKGKVAAFTSWDVFPYIINDKRSGIYVSTGVQEVKTTNPTDAEKMLNKMILSVPNPLEDVRLDAFTFYYGLEYLKKNKPKVLYFSFDETDDFAHRGEYGAYLNSANYTDKFISELWTYLQSETQYKNKTTLIITSDHGRGDNTETWTDHGQGVPVASQIWMTIIGPDTPPLGEVKGESQYYQNQLASTLTMLLGIEYKNEKKPGPPISSILK